MNTSSSVGRGLRGRCPRCGEGRLFEGILKVVDRCAVCGLSFRSHDAGDGPAVAVTFILGTLIVACAMILELAAVPPLWLHFVLWIPLIFAGSLALLRPIKGATIGLQYTHRSVEESERPGGQ